MIILTKRFRIHPVGGNCRHDSFIVSQKGYYEWLHNSMRTCPCHHRLIGQWSKETLSFFPKGIRRVNKINPLHHNICVVLVILSIAFQFVIADWLDFLVFWLF